MTGVHADVMHADVIIDDVMQCMMTWQWRDGGSMWKKYPDAKKELDYREDPEDGNFNLH